MKKYLLLAAAFVTLAVGQAAAQAANVTFDKSTDFSRYKTYKWVTIKDAQQFDELTSGQLIGTFDTALARKGLTKSQSENPDLLIGYQVALGNQKHLNDYNLGGAYGSAAGATTGSGSVTTTAVHTGELVLDMYDAATKQLVWRGVVAKAIAADAKPDKKQKQLDKTVEKLLKDFPPARKS